MASGLKPTTANHFEAMYEAPWGGVASNASGTNLSAGQFANCDGLTIRDGVLCSTSFLSSDSPWTLPLINTVVTKPYYNPGIMIQFVTVSGCFAVASNQAPAGTAAPSGQNSYLSVVFTVPDSSKFSVGITFLCRSVTDTYGQAFNGILTCAALLDPTHIVCNYVTSYWPNTGSGTYAVPATLVYFTGGSFPSGSNVNINLTAIQGNGSVYSSPYYTPYTSIDYSYASAPNLLQGIPARVNGATPSGYNGTFVPPLYNSTFFTINNPSNLSPPSTPAYASVPGVLSYFDYTIFVPYSTGPSTPPPNISWAGANACLIFNCNTFLCAIDQYGFSYIARYQADGTIKFVVDQTAVDGPSTTHGIPDAVKIIQGIAYISVFNTNTVYAYSPGVSYTIATSYAAGKYIDVFNEQLILLNTNSAAKSASDGIQPTRINWSVPDAFSVFDPAVNRLAGYQSLTAVEDYISGFVAADNVGYIFKKEGVTQITATGIAIKPFNFTTYWNSEAGQGLVFPGTLKQYGRTVMLATDSGVFEFYAGAFQSIAGAAKSAIYSSVNVSPPSATRTTNTFSAGISIYPFNDSSPQSEYILIGTTTKISGSIVFWFYNIEGKTWTSVTHTMNALLAAAIGTTSATNISVSFIRTATVFLNPADLADNNISSISNLPVNLVYINFIYTTANNLAQQITSCYFHQVNKNTAYGISTLAPQAFSITFKSEEVKLARNVNIRRIIIKACGVGVITVAVNNVTGTNIVLDGTQNYKTYTSSLIYYGESPQLTLSSAAFSGQIVKAMMVGTYAEGDIK